MSKKVKALVERDIKNRLAGIDGVAVVSPRGLDGLKNNALRGKLHAKGLRMTVVKNTLAKRAAAGSKIDGFDKLLDGPSAVIYGKGVAAPNIARLLLEAKKDNEALDLKGVFFDGEAYVGEAGVKTASKLPTREEAIAALLTAIVSPGRNLGGIFKGQAAKVAALIKAVEEKKEKEGGAPAAA
jgi:large subunit ribosomal protein L10